MVNLTAPGHEETQSIASSVEVPVYNRAELMERYQVSGWDNCSLHPYFCKLFVCLSTCLFAWVAISLSDCHFASVAVSLSDCHFASVVVSLSDCLPGWVCSPCISHFTEMKAFGLKDKYLILSFFGGVLFASLFYFIQNDIHSTPFLI